MSTDIGFKKVKIFVAGPSDVDKERKCLYDVIDGLDRIIADDLGLSLKAMKWELDVPSGPGRPEGQILEQWPVEECDFFIGILWTRFGRRTGAFDPLSGHEYESGTEEEFRRAYSSWQKNKKPHIMFYWRKGLPKSEKDFDTIQYEKVKEFFKEIEDKRLLLYKRYQSPDEFKECLRADLAKTLRQKYGRSRQEQKTEPQFEQMAKRTVKRFEIADLTSHLEMCKRERVPTFLIVGRGGYLSLMYNEDKHYNSVAKILLALKDEEEISIKGPTLHRRLNSESEASNAPLIGQWFLNSEKNGDVHDVLRHIYEMILDLAKRGHFHYILNLNIDGFCSRTFQDKPGWEILKPDTYADRFPRSGLQGTVWEVQGSVTDSSYRVETNLRLEKLGTFLAQKPGAVFLLVGLEKENDKDHPLCDHLPTDAYYYCVDIEFEFSFLDSKLGRLLRGDAVKDSGHLQVEDYPAFFSDLNRELQTETRDPAGLRPLMENLIEISKDTKSSVQRLVGISEEIRDGIKQLSTPLSQRNTARSSGKAREQGVSRER